MNSSKIKMDCLVIIVFILLCVLVGCSSSSIKLTQNSLPKPVQTSTNSKSVYPLTSEDFVIKDKNNYVKLGGKYGDLKTNEKVTKTVSANEMNAYDIYVFENFKILVGVGTIGSIDLTTPVLQTSRGIRIGDTITEVIEKYGDADNSKIVDSIAPGQYVFRHNGEFATFFVDEIGKVVGIRFELV